MARIEIDYIPQESSVTILSDFLRVNYTVEYIQQLTGFNIINAKRVLKYLGEFYDESVGINTKVIQQTAKGVESGLLV